MVASASAKRGVPLERHGRSCWDAGWFEARNEGSPEQTGLGADALEGSDGDGMNINTFQPGGRQSYVPQEKAAGLKKRDRRPGDEMHLDSEPGQDAR